MRIVIDACVDLRVVELFGGHQVCTVKDLGWQQLKDNALVTRIQGQFDIFIIADRGFEHEHNLEILEFGILIAHVAKNKVEFYRLIQAELLAEISRLRPVCVVHVGDSK